MKQTILMLALIQLIISCGLIPTPKDQAELDHYQLAYQRFSYSLKLINESLVDQGLHLIFPMINGSIFVSPSETILHISKGDNVFFDFKVPKLAESKAIVFQPEGHSENPIDTRVMRLGACHSYPYYQNLGDGSFVNGANGNALIFVYFSQQVKITGILQQQSGDTYYHDLDIKETGWHWLEISKESNNKYSINLFRGIKENIYLAVLLDEMAAMR